MWINCQFSTAYSPVLAQYEVNINFLLSLCEPDKGVYLIAA